MQVGIIHFETHFLVVELIKSFDGINCVNAPEFIISIEKYFAKGI